MPASASAPPSATETIAACTASSAFLSRTTSADGPSRRRLVARVAVMSASVALGLAAAADESASEARPRSGGRRAIIGMTTSAAREMSPRSRWRVESLSALGTHSINGTKRSLAAHCAAAKTSILVDGVAGSRAPCEALPRSQR